MNITNWQHLGVAVALQILIGALTGNWWAGAAFGVAVFVGREHAQAEYKYIQKNGGKRHAAPLPPEIGCLHPDYWSRDAVIDVALPALGVGAVAAVMQMAPWITG